jgi:uncharacterized membrane protein YjgN (DUF898 family)
MHGREPAPAAESAFAFEGNWREYAPIAFTNLLLTIVTLGIYRFWATARTRRYLWSRSRFVDEHLEWTGTGKELLVGFLLVMALVLIPFFVATNVAQAMLLRGETVVGGVILLISLLFIFYLGGVAQFRALRYRLARTRWRGIRGGSDDAGFGYGASYMIKSFVGMLPLGLMIPWSMTSLWNERWNKLSFGPYPFEANAEWGGVFKRFLLFYLSPLILFLGVVALVFFGWAISFELQDEPTERQAFVLAIGFVLFFYLGLGLIAVAYYAKFYREVIRATRWNEVAFSFEASTKDWVKLLLGDFALVVFTLGIGSIFLSYRHWKFFMTHMEARGEIMLDTLTQSTTRAGTHGEGLLDAFDVGAI